MRRLEIYNVLINKKIGLCCNHRKDSEQFIRRNRGVMFNEDIILS